MPDTIWFDAVSGKRTSLKYAALENANREKSVISYLAFARRQLVDAQTDKPTACKAMRLNKLNKRKALLQKEPMLCASW